MNRRGVTLLEALVALALTALVLGGLSRSLAGAARSRSAATAESHRLSAARTVLLRLAGEIEAAVGERGIELAPGLGPGSSSRLRLTTVVRSDATSLASDRRTISYGVDSAAGVLLRRERGAPLVADAPEPEPLAVLARVERLGVRCADGTEWRARWDATALPRAVHVVLAVGDGAGGVEELATTVTVALGGAMTMRLLGIEMAPGEVRIARGERRLGRVRLTGLSRLRCGEEEHATILARLAAAGRAQVLTALPASAVVHRTLALPFRDRRRLARTVPLELAGQLAAEVEDAVVAFAPRGDGAGGSAVLAVAARRADVAALAAPLAAAGLAPARVDLAPLPAWNLVGAHAGDAALVVADGTRSSVSVRRGGHVVALRALGTAPARTDAFAAEVRWTLAALDERPPTIVLTGADAAPALAATLAARLGVSLVPLGRVATRPADHLDACAVAAGLVLGADGGIGLRLGGTATPAGSWRTAGALAAAAVLLAAVDLGLWHRRLTERDTMLRDAIRSAAASALPDAPLAAPRAELEAAVASLERGGRQGDAPGALALLREASARVPAALPLDLNELVVEPGALRLGGRAASFEAVEAVRRALAGSPLFAGVAAEEARATVDGRGVEFRLRAERRRTPGTSS